MTKNDEEIDLESNLNDKDLLNLEESEKEESLCFSRLKFFNMLGVTQEEAISAFNNVFKMTKND